MTNKLLARQIKKHLKSFSEEQLNEMGVFFGAIEAAYDSAENDRLLMEHSLEISSVELLTKNKKLAKESTAQQKAIENLELAFKELGSDLDLLSVCGNEDHKNCHEIVALTKSFKKLIHDDKKKQKRIVQQASEIKSQKEALEKFKQAADCFEDQVIFTDPDGIIMYANKQVESATGFSVEKEVIGHKAGTVDLWGTSMPNEFYKDLWETIKVKKETFVGEMKNKTKEGSLYTVETKISPVLDKDNNIIFFLGVSRDITKAKEIDRLKSEFISISSHQLRTPLASMRWLLEMLLDESMGELSLDQKKITTQCFESNQRMIDLVNELLNVSRIEMGTLQLQPKTIHLEKITKSLIRETAPLAKAKSQQVKFASPDKPSPVFADETYIRQAVLNFISNAIKYTPEKGTIRIKMTEKTNQILLEVADNGLGIPEAAQSKIFTKFFRADNVDPTNVEGSGLGLYIVKGVIEGSGGKIGFKSKEGTGTTFYFTLPKKTSLKKK